MQAEMRLLGPDDMGVFENVAADVFDYEIDRERAAEFLDDPRHHIVVGLVNGMLVGMVSGVHYVHPDKVPQLFINEVAVDPAHQNQGIAKQMLGVMLDHGRALGCSEAWVLTDSDNTIARELYASAGGESEPQLMYSYRLDQ